MPIDTHLKQKLEEMDEKYSGDNMYKMFGPSLLAGGRDIDSSRAYMFTAHIKQCLTLLNPDVPRLASGFENAIGKYNKSYKELSGEWEVKDIIPKFENKGIYMLVLYNTETKTYDMIERPIAENLTEKFGYEYNTECMDSLKVGDFIRDDILYKSTSYDDNMNYRFGKNARVLYSISTDTLEDSIAIRRSWANKVLSTEVDNVEVSINTNDILLNLYGDNDDYKVFPDIGEKVKNSEICASRRINNSHIIYDFQSDNLKHPYDTDKEYFVSKNSIVYDIDVFYNGDEEFPDNLFHKQLKKYYEAGCKYAYEVLKWCNKIKSSKSKYTMNILRYRDKYLNYNNDEYKWRNKDKAFKHIIVKFKVKSAVPLEHGSKITGRYGNKGVIASFNEDEPAIGLDPNITATVIDDERMPFYYDPDTGERINVDILLSQSGSVRRLNPAQLMEVELNFIAERIQHRLQVMTDMKEKEDLIFKFLSMVNMEHAIFYHNLYNSYDQTVETTSGYKLRMLNPGAKEKFIKSIEDNGFYLVRMIHTPLRYEDITALYDEFPWIEPVQLYINLFGTKNRKVMRKAVVGYEYMMILKQNSSKNFSARSTGSLNRTNQPAKDSAKKTNRSSYAKTPVRLTENHGLLPAISGRIIATYGVYGRTSPIGRKEFGKILASKGDPLEIKKLNLKDAYRNSSADTLNAYMKAIGLRIEFITAKDSDIENKVYSNVAMPLQIRGYTIYDKYENLQYYNQLFDEYISAMESFTMIESSPGEKSDYCWDMIKETDSVKEILKKLNLTENDISMFKDLTKNGIKDKLSTIKK